ncbi:hypothetical protein Efla_005067 [Eimeria flavescens]
MRAAAGWDLMEDPAPAVAGALAALGEGAPAKLRRARLGGPLLLLSGALTILTLGFMTTHCWRQLGSQQAGSARRWLAEGGRVPHKWPSLSDLCISSAEGANDEIPSTSGGGAPAAESGGAPPLYAFPRITEDQARGVLQAVLRRLEELALPESSSRGISNRNRKSVAASSADISVDWLSDPITRLNITIGWLDLREYNYSLPRIPAPRDSVRGWPNPESIEATAQSLEESLIKLSRKVIRRRPGASDVLEMSMVKREGDTVVAKISLTLIVRHPESIQGEIIV